MPQLEERDLYKVSNWEVVKRNFLVGISRGLGSLVVQIIFFALVYFSIVQLVLPRLSPFLNRFPFGTRSESSKSEKPLQDTYLELFY